MFRNDFRYDLHGFVLFVGPPQHGCEIPSPEFHVVGRHLRAVAQSVDHVLADIVFAQDLEELTKNRYGWGVNFSRDGREYDIHSGLRFAVVDLDLDVVRLLVGIRG